MSDQKWAHKRLAGIPKVKTPLEGNRRWWEDSINMDLKETR
jgi:hypothetical protein